MVNAGSEMMFHNSIIVGHVGCLPWLGEMVASRGAEGGWKIAVTVRFGP